MIRILFDVCAAVTGGHCRDYRPMPHLDVYNAEDIDEQDYEGLSPTARAAAEKEMRKRDRQDALTHGRTRPGLLYGECV